MPKNILHAVLLPLVAGASAALAGCATPGVNAAVRGDAPRLQRVLDRPNHGGEDLGVLLTNAVAFDCAECVREVLKAGARPDAAQLSAAALAGREPTAKLLLGSGADPAAAMALIHAQTRTWAGGCCLSPEQAQRASGLLKNLERETAPDAPAAAVSPAAVAPEAPPSRLVPSFQEAARPDDYALVVGVEKYDGLSPAADAERNAAAVADFARALGVPARNVVVLIGARATRTALAKNLEGRLADAVDENSTVYFYYAGRAASDAKSGLAYLLPSDGDPKYLEQTAYPLKRVYETLGALKAKRSVVLLESGFPAAGADAGFNSADGRIALLTAADAGQLAGTDAERGYGLFTERLLDGLNGAARDASGRVTLESLYSYAKPRVADDARRAGRAQVPQFQSGGSATDGVLLRGR